MTATDRIAFNCPEHGRLTGTVLDVFRDITNGALMATVEIDHELPGIVHLIHHTQIEPNTATNTTRSKA